MTSGPLSSTGFIPGPEFLRKARRFWDWFEQEHRQIEEWLDDPDAPSAFFIAREMNPRISPIAELQQWDIRRGEETPYVMSFRFGGLRNRALIEYFVSMAPMVDRWRIFAGRPAQPWSGKLTWSDKTRAVAELETGTWRYILAGFDSGALFDIAVIPSDLPTGLDAVVKDKIVHCAIEYWIGEILYLDKVDQIDILESPSEAQRARSLPMPGLVEHLRRLLAEPRKSSPALPFRPA